LRRFVYSILLCLVIPALAQEAPAPQESSSAQNAAETANTRKVDHLPTDDAGKAEAAILKGDWKAAEPLLSSWLAGHPDDASALFDAGYVADAQGRNEDAIGFYRKATEADPASFEAEVSLGLLLARLGRTEEARPILEKSTNLDAGSSQPQAKAKAWRAMAQIDLSGSGGEPDLAQASIDLLEALKLTPETAADTLLAARIAEAGGDSTAAEAAYRRALKSDAGSSIASAGLAHLLIAQKKYADAESLLQTARKKSPDDAALTAQLAAVMVAEDKTDALPLLQEFHSKHPQDQAITRMLAEVLADAGEYTESEALYTTLLAATPKDSHLLSGHGQNLIRLHRYPEALKAFESATEIDETNGEAWNGLAFAAFQTHEPTITLHALTVRSKYLPESATVYFLWATAYDTLHDTKQAVAYYHRFLDSAQGKFPDQEWQARQRMKVLDKAP
jgi:tetratricopeptide (TPR) repeat protein